MKGIVRAALRAATERLRQDLDGLRSDLQCPDGSIDPEDRALLEPGEDLLRQCDAALRAAGTVWTTGEVLVAVERVLGPLKADQASAIVTALRTGHLTPVPASDPPPTRPAA